MATEPICTIDQALQTLNDALAADPAAINALFTYETECNRDLADHPTIQVRGYDRDTGEPLLHGPFYVRLMGIINGLFGADEDDWGYLAMDIDDRGLIAGFIRVPSEKADSD